jgi:hypothetical protein
MASAGRVLCRTSDSPGAEVPDLRQFENWERQVNHLRNPDLLYEIFMFSP